ncbi:MAG: hypothetical protein AAB594_01155 [Patescibacteria group bacterium]
MQGSQDQDRSKSAQAKKSHRRLSDEDKRKVFDIVAGKMTPDDRDPQEVIRTTYRGNETRWCHDMIRNHDIKL